ncbi:hypothetical protein [Caulobacter segnis]|uniref:Uncharacterized protein n=1 Tax=Caulobacter segnis TaxID=88688 RepID=A0A2W5V923_9CAUL|nr:hypothetical protein [Caulobacter segnis]PZR36509.1 MAG: hypothetical protein DI526_03470 [Caulobacter segnis]
MSGKWPDGGEQPLTRRERLIMGAVGVVLVAALVGLMLLAALSLMGRRPTPVAFAAVAAISVSISLLWVRPWDGPPSTR